MKAGFDATMVAKMMIDSGASRCVGEHYDEFIAYGAEIDTASIIREMRSEDIAKHYDDLIAHGAKLKPKAFYELKDDFFDIEYIIHKYIEESSSGDGRSEVDSTRRQMHENWQKYLEAGFDATTVAEILITLELSKHIFENYDEFIAHGAKLDIASIVEKMSSADIGECYDELIAHGAELYMSKSFYETKGSFERMVKGFNSKQEEIAMEAELNMHKNWRKYLETGFNATVVAGMMSPADIVAHYDELLSYGAKPDVPKMFVESERIFDKDFVESYWGELVHCGVSLESLIERCRYWHNTATLEKLASRGVAVEELFEMAKHWLSGWYPLWAGKSGGGIGILTWFCDHGAPKADIKEWLAKKASSWRNGYEDLDDYIIETGSDFYEKLEIESLRQLITSE